MRSLCCLSSMFFSLSFCVFCASTNLCRSISACTIFLSLAISASSARRAASCSMTCESNALRCAACSCCRCFWRASFSFNDISTSSVSSSAHSLFMINLRRSFAAAQAGSCSGRGLKTLLNSTGPSIPEPPSPWEALLCVPAGQRLVEPWPLKPLSRLLYMPLLFMLACLVLGKAPATPNCSGGSVRCVSGIMSRNMGGERWPTETFWAPSRSSISLNLCSLLAMLLPLGI
mmetsp:Transcript_24979/g.67927  ORF Transcript_24979/g.67927 Transcript_24979/m.67927 type:complete len:231 (-) Transcript_24979:149-841(-)